ncbi:hypothetical protein KKC83_00685 [Patescibacteria group bacterium]|nr:hypothetical protein [Patescibacteria group bacterium]MBU4015662.1 hypothetical protein [Patescibacteria group bacterium]MBU4026053.1 hypothetical protein [Patescibacteria group bacterium]MBU4102227.1 hypothetical protein [Patescibacteria group bacterium]MBU4125777.1 hypothetical protein [Patescibacteria group bacterium]
MDYRLLSSHQRFDRRQSLTEQKQFPDLRQIGELSHGIAAHKTVMLFALL